MNERIFTIKDLLEFCVNGEHWASFSDSVRFVVQFAESHGIDITAEVESAQRKWCELNGYDYDEIFGQA